MSTDSPPKTVAYFLDPDVGNFHYGSLNIQLTNHSQKSYQTFHNHDKLKFN